MVGVVKLVNSYFGSRTNNDSGISSRTSSNGNTKISSKWVVLVLLVPIVVKLVTNVLLLVKLVAMVVVVQQLVANGKY